MSANDRIGLIRDLLETRVQASSSKEADEIVNVGTLSVIDLLNTPEATLVEVLETIIFKPKTSLVLNDIFKSIEAHRKKLGSNRKRFNEILAHSEGLELGSDIGDSVEAFCRYRLDVEHGQVLSEEEVYFAFKSAATVISNW